MKTLFRHYAPVVGLLAALLAVAVLLCCVAAPAADGDGQVVVTTTYPLYLAAKNLTAGTDITVTTLSGASAGCLHDYQLSPADRLALERADAVLVNGLGAEPFLEGLDLPTRDMSATVAHLLCATGHHHDHDGHYHDEAAYNEHVWTSPTRYAAQVAAVTEALADMTADSAMVLGNANVYQKAVAQVIADLQAVKAALAGTPCVVFHPSLAYLADEVGLDVKLTLTVGEDSGLSAADLAAVEDLVAQNPATLLLYDSQYTARYPAVDKLVPAARVLTLHSGTTGPGRDTDWLDTMRDNVKLLETLTEDTP